MKAFLMHKDRDFDIHQSFPSQEQDLVNDLELTTLFNAMARGDRFLFDIAKRALLFGSSDLETIRYRQDILKDCLRNPSVIRAIYQLPIESSENKKKHWYSIITFYPAGVLRSAISMMQMFVILLRRLKRIADDHIADFESEGFRTFFTMVQKELDDEYFDVIENHLKNLKFRNGVLISAELGSGNEGTNYVLRKPHPRNPNLIKQVFTQRQPTYSYTVHPRDDHGAKALADLTDRGINLVANALAQSSEHIDSFFKMLQIELAFYVGCINLHEQLAQIDEPVCFPQPVASDQRAYSFEGLYDICLALTKKQKVVGNDVNADHKNLVIITGANQGGKSTFLRSIGVAQLMMQSGMYVPATRFSANLCKGVFTHYKRREDTTMKSGKLDEELSRMSTIVDSISPNALMLFNESFAATNEREGSEIARQITSALLDRNVKVFFVTHMYEFAHIFYAKRRMDAIFLRAERKEGGKRTFKLMEGEPLQTSFGEDVYKAVFRSQNEKV